MLMLRSEIASSRLWDLDIGMAGDGPTIESLFLNSFIIFVIRPFLVIYSVFLATLSVAKLDLTELWTLLDL